MMFIRFLMIVAAAVVAVLLLKVVVAVAIVGAVAFGCLFAFNVARRTVLGGGARRRFRGRPAPRTVAPLARPNISVRR